MDELKRLIRDTNPNPNEVQRLVDSVTNGQTQCTSFIARASTAVVHKVCPVHSSGECGKDCFAIKTVNPEKNRPLNTKEAEVQKRITVAVQGSAAEAHFNKLVQLLPSQKGPVIVLEFETPRAVPFQSLSALLQKADISEQLWKSINFQLIKSIYAAQQRIPGFTHGDTHTQNILIVPNETSHACTITTPSGKRLAHFATLLIRIIDFGQVLALDDRFQTPDGLAIWKKNMFRNKMIDFVRFAVWATFDCAIREGEYMTYPEWYEPWLEFVYRWIDPRFFINGAPNDGEFVDPSMGMCPNEKGAQWLQEWYGPESTKGIGNMLDDPYFNEFTMPELKFSAHIKPKQGWTDEEFSSKGTGGSLAGSRSQESIRYLRDSVTQNIVTKPIGVTKTRSGSPVRKTTARR